MEHYLVYYYRKVTDEQMKDYQHQIENLTQEHTKLLEDVEKNVSTPVQTTENESQTDDYQHEKLTQVNNKLKSALQTYKEKVNRVASERPDLFDGIGEETSEHLDHLISTLASQATQIDVLHAQHDQTEKQLQTEIKELQRYENNIFTSLNISFPLIFIVLWKHINIKSKMNVPSRWNNLYLLLHHLRLLKISG
jgi:small-conductance mechanosensitive channel